MNRTRNCIELLSIFGLLLAPYISQSAAAEPPPIAREFRAAWVATVENIDWPSRPGLSTDEQRQELAQLFDKAAELHLNAIVLQVRPACDTIYPSKLEPWSHYLTGEMGKPPEPLYDPLQYAIDLAHARGMELHAWFNPFRAKHSAAADVATSPGHVSRAQPEIVRRYGNYLWLDPGEPQALDHTLAVMLEVVNHYDVDGVHLDDYFYPYPINDDSGKKLPFPDDLSWEKRGEAKRGMSRDDWRRNNVNSLIERMYRDVKRAKPWVKVGISPFGIWRPNHPPGIQGFDPYAELYADALLWWHNGWVDYLTPQLYWKIDSQGQSYPKLLHWWDAENRMGRHLWPGNYTSRLAGSGGQTWEPQELIDQINVTRAQERAGGNVHFSMKAFLRDYGGINQPLKELYRDVAIAPASAWLEGKIPPQPPAMNWDDDGSHILIAPTEDAHTRWWVVQSSSDDRWTTKVYPADQALRLSVRPEGLRFLTAVTRAGIASQAIPLPQASPR